MATIKGIDTASLDSRQLQGQLQGVLPGLYQVSNCSLKVRVDAGEMPVTLTGPTRQGKDLGRSGLQS